MKKILFVIAFVACMCSCTSNHYYRARVVYDICWPDTTIRYDTIVNCSYSGDEDKIKCFNASSASSRGTNYLHIYPGWNYIEETTAPIRVISFKLVK